MNKTPEKKSLYIETSVVSYLTAKSTRDLILKARQQITKLWWKQINLKFEPFISAYVIDEISKGDTVAAQSRLDAISGFNLLQTSAEIDNLAKVYFKKIRLPEHALYDCLHIACGVLNGIDIIVSWNFKHIANPVIRQTIREINQKLGFETPEITTPEELMEGEI